MSSARLVADRLPARVELVALLALSNAHTSRADGLDDTSSVLARSTVTP
jgi:hypothetical protein